ncbi:KPN_02809 family neutral zinc metallopeptidase [Sphingobacterium spiritivorum]|uniref:Neutral zinc metallopeptidase n=1 Tax=Sphingobacterium spiritivorum ATCC 33861 TaxID=525373 RepID=D7VSK6_SPHSI|nr:neutral zinc metallopeptidase [Sphingobacterium spiritivorum]EFK56757.1 putative neutral zinc metallopeptidase [Sphingobacterium spiritivorum ATCC 33861]QQT35210.1 neutral zinc metallopeptidase [Sphingobacterium spiritivorum]WQD36120.1 neutral zinc metallopeptidase [Sphingobacterium spiritivorum]SUJ03805.1 Predicted metalloprotease [Sphingobacterium spiritivorum]
MKWQGGRQSDNFQDRRGMSGGQKFAIGGIGGVIILVIGFLMGGDPGQLMEQLQNANVGAPQTEQGEVQLTEEEKQLTAFSRTVLASTEDVWTKVFKDNGLTYQTADLVVYTGGTQTEGCGVGKASYGPFYCPGDHNVYLDLSFNQELQQKFGAKGEFALAYVIAHEVGHHIQNLVGTLNKTNQMRQQMSESEYNKVSVMTELQADFYAGVWAHYVNQLSDIKIDYNDILDGMQAAEAVGDDKLQEQAQGYAVPESFTHGTSEQRARWFKKGYDTGDLKAGDTFSDRSLR